MQDKEKHSKIIPHGPYCYDSKGNCPYWSQVIDKPNQANGHCSYLNIGDWESLEEPWIDIDGNEVKDFALSHTLLWDQVKECGINEE